MDFSKFGSVAVALLLVLCSVSSVLCYPAFKLDSDSGSRVADERYLTASAYFPFSYYPLRYPVGPYEFYRGSTNQNPAQHGEKRFDTLNGEMYGR